MNEIAHIEGAFDRRSKKLPHLLIVEDDETDVMVIKRCHARYGSEVKIEVARDGSEALEILRQGKKVQRPYVIVTDLNMPGMSGHEMIDEIRGDEVLRDSVIFVFSSSRLAGDIDRAYSQNVAGYLSKQRTSEDLSKGVEMILDYCKAVHLPA